MRRALQALAGLAVAGTAIVASFVRVLPGWTPAGDVATLVIRAGDVGGRHTPLLGMPSTANPDGASIYHPGPLQLWLVGLGRLLWDGRRVALLLAVLVNLACVVVTLHWARRLWGPAGAAAAATALAAIGWSLRGEVLASPFNPYVGVLPFAAYLVALVAARAGVRGALVGAVLTGSWAAQCHLGYLGPVLGAALVAGLGAVPDLRVGGRARRRALAPLVAVAVCWAGPLVDVAVHGGGNVRALLEREGQVSLGARHAVEVLVNALAPRPVFAQAGAIPLRLLAAPTVVEWALATVLVGAAGWVAVRRTGDHLGQAAAVSLAALAAGTVLTAFLPDLTFNSLALHNYLFLWPATALLWAVLLGTVAERLRSRAWAGPVLTGALLAVGTALAVGSLARPHRPLQVAEREQVRALGPEVVAAVDPRGRYLVQIDPSFDVFAIETGLAADLDRAGIEITVPATFARAYGAHRAQGAVAGRILTVLGGAPPPVGRAELLVRRTLVAPRGRRVAVSVYLVPAAPQTAARPTANGTVAPS